MDRKELERLLEMTLEKWIASRYPQHLQLARFILWQKGCKSTTQCSEDAVQNAYRSFNQAVLNFKGASSFDAYFNRILANACTALVMACPQCGRKVDLEEDTDGFESRDNTLEGKYDFADPNHNDSEIRTDEKRTKERGALPDPFIDPDIACLRESVCCALEREKQDRDTEAKKATVPKGWCFVAIRLHELTGQEVAAWLQSPHDFNQTGLGDVIRVDKTCNKDLFILASTARQALEKTTVWMIEHHDARGEKAHIVYLNMAGSLKDILPDTSTGGKSGKKKARPYGFSQRYLRPCLIENGILSSTGGKSGCDKESYDVSN